MITDKEANFLARNDVYDRASSNIATLNKKLADPKITASQYRKSTQDLNMAEKKFSTIRKSMSNKPGRIIKGALKNSGKFLRKAFIRI